MIKQQVILLIFFLITPISLFSQGKEIQLTTSTKNEWSVSKKGKVSVMYKIDKLHFDPYKKVEGYYELSFPGAIPDGPPGSPELPVYKKIIEVPHGAKINVSVKRSTRKKIILKKQSITGLIKPVQPSLSKGIPRDSIEFVRDEKKYTRNSFFRRDMVRIEQLGNFRGNRLARVVIDPVRYNPVRGELIVFNNIELEISFELADFERTEQIKLLNYSPVFEPIYKSIGIEHDYEDHPDLTSYPVKYLIVSPRMFEEELQPLIHWKTSKGYSIVTGYTDSIGTSYNEIRTWIHDQYNEASGIGMDQKPSFLLLVGDVAQLASQTGSRTGRYTDINYASVDGDYFPEMYYGRLSAADSADLVAIIDKILSYEKYNFSDHTYLDDVTLIAGVDGTNNTAYGQPTINYATQNFFNTENGFDTVYSYLNSYTGCYATIDSGIGFINYTAHGTLTSWYNPSFTNASIDNLSNVNKYPLAIGNCCETGNFGYGVCFGEKWLRAKNKGAIGYIGSAPDSYWDEDMYWALGAFSTPGSGSAPDVEETSLGVYDAPFMSDYLSLGALMFVGNLAVTEADLQSFPGAVSPEYYWQAYNILGDPSLTPYFKHGELNLVSHMDVFPPALSSFEVEALQGSYVGISQDSILIGAGYVDENGFVSIPVIDTVKEGEICIVITKPQYQPVFDTIPAINIDDPYIVMHSYELLDTAIGNGNGIPEYGELIHCNMVLKNVGGEASQNDVIARLMEDDTYIDLLDSLANFGIIDSLNGNDTSMVNSAFSFQIENITPDQHMCIFTVRIMNGDSIWESRFIIHINSPELIPGDTYINDTTYGNGNGVLEPDESGKLVLKLENIGRSDVTNTIVYMSCDNPYLIINKEYDTLFFLEKESTGVLDFEVELTSDAPEDLSMPIYLYVTAGEENQFVYYDTIIFKANYIPEYTISNGTLTVCKGYFYDTGGKDGNYGNNENITMTIAPCCGEQAVNVAFTSFYLENPWDFLYVYNGSSTSAPQIEGSPYTGTNCPSYIMADNDDGTLTFRFDSDGNTVTSGWEASINCFDPLMPPDCSDYIELNNDTTDVIPYNVRLEWEKTDYTLKYNIYLDTIADPDVFDSTTNTYYVINSHLEPNTKYYWKVVPSNRGGEAAGCEVYSFTTGPQIVCQSNLTLTMCNGFYYDSGGPFGNYSNYENDTFIFVPSDVNYLLQVDFESFNIENGWDQLYIYDGEVHPDSLVGGEPYSGSTSPGTILASNPRGILTFLFVSDESVTRPGWKAEVTCIPRYLQVQAKASKTNCFINDSIQLDANVAGGTWVYNYHWSSLPVDAAFTDTTIINPVVYPYQDTKYTITVDDGDSIVSSSVLITASEYIPHIVVPKTNKDSIVRGSEVQLSGIVTGGSENYSYLWRCIPSDTSLHDSLSLTTSVSPTVTTIYSLIVDDEYSIQDSSVTIFVFEPSLNIYISILDSAICYGDTTQLTATISGGIGNYDYEWSSNPVDGTLQDPEKLTITVKPVENTKYIINVNDNLENISDTLDLIVNPIPDPPLINLVDDSLLVSDYFEGNIWYLNDTLLTTIIGYEFAPDNSGNYYAVVDQNNCTSMPSNVIYFNYIPTILYSDVSKKVIVKPNPFIDYLTISCSSQYTIQTIDLMSITGQVLCRQENINSLTHVIDTKNLLPGTYFLKVKMSGSKHVFIIVK